MKDKINAKKDILLFIIIEKIICKATNKQLHLCQFMSN